MCNCFTPEVWRTGTKPKEFACLNILHPSMADKGYLKMIRPLTKWEAFRRFPERHINQAVSNTSLPLMYRKWVNVFIYPTSTAEGFQKNNRECNIYKEWKRSVEGVRSFYVPFKYFLFLCFLPRILLSFSSPYISSPNETGINKLGYSKSSFSRSKRPRSFSILYVLASHSSML